MENTETIDLEILKEHIKKKPEGGGVVKANFIWLGKSKDWNMGEQSLK